MPQSAPFTKTDLKKMKKDELVALVMKQQEENKGLKEKIEEKVEEIECRHSYWETKEGEFTGEIADLVEEIEEYKSICREYLDGSEDTATPKYLNAYVEEKTDKIAELVEEIECRFSTWQTQEGEYKEEIAMLYRDFDRLLNGKGGVEEKLEEVRDYLELFGQDCAEVFDRIMKGED